MPSSYSPSLSLELIAAGEQAGLWGDTTNKNLGTLLEQAIAGVATIAVSTTDVTLTTSPGISNQARNAVLLVTGTTSAIRSIICPLVQKLYFVKNSTSGGYAITVKGATGATATIPNGTMCVVYCDGSGYYVATSPGVTSITAGSGITVGGTSLAPTITNSGVLGVTAGTAITVTGTASNPIINATGTIAGVSSVTAGTAITVTGTASNPIINNAGVTSVSAGTGMTVGGTASVPIVNNGGVTSLTAGTGIGLTGGPTGAITINATGTAGVSTFSGGTTGLTPSSATTGAITLAGTLGASNGGTGVTTSTGSGSNVLSNSPSLVTPILGTPASGTLTNCTGYPYVPSGTGAVTSLVQTKLRENVSLLDFGADPTGVADATTAVQNAINSLPSGGGRIFVPQGIYKLTNQINVNKTVEFYGTGWSSVPSNTVQNVGSVFVCTFNTTVAADVFYCTAPHTEFRNLEIFCNYQPADAPGWTPTTTPAAIHFYRANYTILGADDPVVDNVMIRGMTVGVSVSGPDRGEFNIYGQTFGPLLYIDGSYDVAHIKNVHYWVWYNAGTYQMAWILANVKAVTIGRCDNPQFTDVFAYHVNAGIYWVASSVAPGPGSQRNQMGNVDVDDCYYGLLFNSNAETTVQIANLVVYTSTGAGTNSVPTRGVWATGTSDVKLTIANAHFTGIGGEAIRLEASGSDLMISNLRVDSYNQQNNGFYAVYGASTLGLVGSNAFITNGNGMGPFAPTGCQYFFIGSNSFLPTNPGFQSETCLVYGVPTKITRNFGRTSVICTAGAYTAWTVTLPVALSAVYSASSSTGNSNTGVAVDIYDGLTFPLGARTTATGSVYSPIAVTVLVDWEVTGY